MAEFLYYARLGQAFSIYIPHKDPTGRGNTSSSVTEKEIEAWKGKVTC